MPNNPEGFFNPPSKTPGEKAPAARTPDGKNLLLIGAVFALVLAVRFIPGRELIHTVLDWISSQGLLGYLAFFLLYVAASVFLIPASILTLGAGFVFGVVRGSLLVSASSTAGAVAAFLVGRYLARGRVASWLESDPRFDALDRAVARQGWKIVAMVRLSPLFPFILVNYAFGLTRIGLRDYALASWLGMAPATLLFVYLGSLAEELALAGVGARSRTPLEWVFYAAGLAATVAVAFYVTRLARAALAKNLE